MIWNSCIQRKKRRQKNLFLSLCFYIFSVRLPLNWLSGKIIMIVEHVKSIFPHTFHPHCTNTAYRPNYVHHMKTTWNCILITIKSISMHFIKANLFNVEPMQKKPHEYSNRYYLILLMWFLFLAFVRIHLDCALLCFQLNWAFSMGLCFSFNSAAFGQCIKIKHTWINRLHGILWCSAKTIHIIIM